MTQAIIGLCMEIYSKYKAVLNADGPRIRVYINYKSLICRDS